MRVISLYFIICVIVSNPIELFSQLKVGNNKATISSNTFFEIEAINGNKFVVKRDSIMMGINNTNPSNRLEITHGASGNSGLRFTNLTNASSSVSANSINSKFLSVNNDGDVVLANSVDQVISVSGLASNMVSPVAAATFQAGTFENSYSKTDSTILYLNQADGTTWVYSAINGGQYKSYVAPASTAWYLSSGTTDAGSNKTNSIYRTGRIGIGTTSPTANLDVVGGFSLRNIAAGAGTNYGIEFNTNSNSPRIDWVYNGSYTGSFAGDADFFFRLQNSKTGAGGFRFLTNPAGVGVERLTILNNGNIGVGNTTPIYRFDVAGKGRFTDTLFGSKAQFNNLALGSITDSIVTIDASGNLKMRSPSTYSNNWFVRSTTTPSSRNADSIYQMGFVGIGLSNPQYNLHVNGNARFTPNTNNNGTGEPVTIDVYGKIPTASATPVGGIRLGWYSTFGGIDILRGPSALGVGLGFNYANTSTGATIEGMRLTFNGNLSIGTTSETSLLTLKVDSAAASSTAIDFTLKNAPTVLSRIQTSKFNSTNTSVMTFHTRASDNILYERVRIDSAGRVGIGTSTPNWLLDVQTNSNASMQTAHFVNLNSGTSAEAQIGIGGGPGAWTKIVGYNGALGVRNYSTAAELITIKTGSGNVGIGVVNPISKLEINGAATNTVAFNAATGTTIDFSQSNMAYTTASAGAFTLTNIKDGGTYTLAVQGATSGTSSFSASGFTFRSINNGATTANKHTLYTFLVMGTNVYFYMATGF